MDRTCFSFLAYVDDIVLLGEEEQKVIAMCQINRISKKGETASQQGKNTIYKS